MNEDWRVFRPAIWMAMLGVALILLLNPPYVGALVLGASIGVALRIRRRRQRVAAGLPPRGRRRR